MEHLCAQDTNCTQVLKKKLWEGANFIHQIQNKENSRVLVNLSRIKKSVKNISTS